MCRPVAVCTLQGSSPSQALEKCGANFQRVNVDTSEFTPEFEALNPMKQVSCAMRPVWGRGAGSSACAFRFWIESNRSTY